MQKAEAGARSNRETGRDGERARIDASFQFSQSSSATAEIEKQLCEAEQKVRNMTEILSKAGHSEALLAQLRSDEQRLAEVKGRLAVLQGDRERAREILTRHLEPIILTPMDDGRWQLNAALDLSTVIGDSARPETGRVTEDESSGGAIFPHSVTPLLAQVEAILAPGGRAQRMTSPQNVSSTRVV